MGVTIGMEAAEPETAERSVGAMKRIVNQ